MTRARVNRPIPGGDPVMLAIYRLLALREAQASVALDHPGSGVHTCHEECPCQRRVGGES